MKNVTLTRLQSSDQGTFGHLAVEGSPFTCVTGELPWRDNAPNLSRIPVGVYTCRESWSDHFQAMLYHVLNVPGRGSVEIHWGNWCGDIVKGYKSDVEGCILLGNALGELAPPDLTPQKAVVGSKTTVLAFMAHLQGLDFQLTVQDNFPVAA